MDDSVIKSQVQNKIIFEPALNQEGINVSVDKGIVTLSGTVPTYSDKYLAEFATRNVKGVRGIVEELQVDLLKHA
jgi:osmotically-inducible protein OsmY